MDQLNLKVVHFAPHETIATIGFPGGASQFMAAVDVLGLSEDFYGGDNSMFSGCVPAMVRLTTSDHEAIEESLGRFGVVGLPQTGLSTSLPDLVRFFAEWLPVLAESGYFLELTR